MTARLAIALLAAALPAAADAPLLATPLEVQPGGIAAPSAPEPDAAAHPVVDEDASADAQADEGLSEAEARIRAGIILLDRLHALLASVKDRDTAEAAVAPVMRAIPEFQTWAQGFSALPPLDEDTKRQYEKRYLPLIEELNSRLRAQGARISSAEFYGSQNLAAALVRLVTSSQ